MRISVKDPAGRNPMPGMSAPSFSQSSRDRIAAASSPRDRPDAVAEEVMKRADAECRGFSLLEPRDVRAVNPALRGRYLAGLHCAHDAAV